MAPPSGRLTPWNLDRLFSAADKDTIIRLRWPLVILSSYLLYYSPSHWLTPSQVQALLILYLLSHSTLYFLADKLFDSPYFYGPLLLLDTVVLAVVIEMSGNATPVFFVACLLTLVLSCICNDARGLLAVTLLAPLVYAYFVFSRTGETDPEIYLQLPFPFVISLFYGYFAQVERLRRSAREKEDQAKRQQKAAEALRRERERLEVLHDVNLAVTSAVDRSQILEAFLTRTLIHLPYAAAFVRLKNHVTGCLETVAAEGIELKRLAASEATMEFIDQSVAQQQPLAVDNVFADPRFGRLELFQEEGLVALLALPLVAHNEALGCLTLLTRQEHPFDRDEIDFLSTLASQAALAIHHAQLYEQSRQQSDELRRAHRIKDRLVETVSAELKTSLNVIAGYTEMFRDRLLGQLTPIQEQAIDLVARHTRALQNLIGSVLLVTDLEAESVQVEAHELNLWEFLSELRSAYEQSRVKDLTLMWDYPADLPTVRCDRSKLDRILRNLIDNAIKFTDAGTVTIALHYRADQQSIECRIGDSGVGIPATQLNEIFEGLSQVENDKANLPRGQFGLGLYVVKKFVDALGGAIDVVSQPGVGTTFTVRIPAPLDHLSVVKAPAESAQARVNVDAGGGEPSGSGGAR
jgi:signal transduction histidine kinase